MLLAIMIRIGVQQLEVHWIGIRRNKRELLCRVICWQIVVKYLNVKARQ